MSLGNKGFYAIGDDIFEVLDHRVMFGKVCYEVCSESKFVKNSMLYKDGRSYLSGRVFGLATRITEIEYVKLLLTS